MTAAEPIAEYTMRDSVPSGITYTNEETKKTDKVSLGMFGFYTDDAKMFEQRVKEIEADMDEIDAGIENTKKWISSEQMWAELYQDRPWLK